MGFLNGITPLKSTAASTQTLTSPVDARSELAKATNLNMLVTSPAVGFAFGLDKAASLPITVTGSPTVSTGPTIMDLNKRSDRRLMRRYIRSQKDINNVAGPNPRAVARNVNAWEAVRNMRRAQNEGIRWDSTGHLVLQGSLPLITPKTPLVNPISLLLNTPNVQLRLNSVQSIGNYQVSGVPLNYGSLPIQNNLSSSNAVLKLNSAPYVTNQPSVSTQLNVDTSAQNWRNASRSGSTVVGVTGETPVAPANLGSEIQATPQQSVTAVPGRTFTHQRTADGHWIVLGTDGKRYVMYGMYDYRPIDEDTPLYSEPNDINEPSLWDRAKSFVGGLFLTNGINYLSTSETIDGKTVYINPNTGLKYVSNGFGKYTLISKNGGVLKALSGALILEVNPNTSALKEILNNPRAFEGFRQLLSKYTGKEVTEDELRTMAADPEIGPQLEQLAQQVMKQSAKLGAKLEYIARLRGKCPDGQELVYFAKGGKICSACMGKKMEDGGEAGYMKSFRDRQKKKLMEKCGGKMKKSK